MCFCFSCGGCLDCACCCFERGWDLEGVVEGADVVVGSEDEEGLLEGLLMESSRDAGGPTGTMREPNSTPMVTSWWGEKRPSQSRTVNCLGCC